MTALTSFGNNFLLFTKNEIKKNLLVDEPDLYEQRVVTGSDHHPE